MSYNIGVFLEQIVKSRIAGDHTSKFEVVLYSRSKSAAFAAESVTQQHYLCKCGGFQCRYCMSGYLEGYIKMHCLWKCDLQRDTESEWNRLYFILLVFLQLDTALSRNYSYLHWFITIESLQYAKLLASLHSKQASYMQNVIYCNSWVFTVKCLFKILQPQYSFMPVCITYIFQQFHSHKSRRLCRRFFY